MTEPVVRRRYYENGSIKEEYWYLDNLLHRVDGPALIYYNPNGSLKEENWWLNNQLHRTDGPAIIWYKFYGFIKEKCWFLNGKKLTKEEIENLKLDLEIKSTIENWLTHE
jgi:antitoxin component YwqK of YwqJK toxin-antitoxin module